jgi:hypothetical protein
MDRSCLLTELDRPRQLSLSTETWRAAAVLAGLRVAVNDRIRVEDRDRGEHKNWLADIWGTIGELVALRALESVADLCVKHHPIDFQGSVDEVDLVASATDGPLRLEAKTHLLEPGKSWFMVNKRARDRSQRRGAVGHLPVIGVLGGRHARVGRLIPSEQLQAWGAPDKPLKDPAVGVRLCDLARECFGTKLCQLEAAVQEGGLSISREQLTLVAAGAGRDLARWQALLPPLEDLSAREVVEAIERLL